MTFREAAQRRFGAEWVAALDATAGCHTVYPAEVPLPMTEERLLYGFLEAVDSECPSYLWTCPGRCPFQQVLVPTSMEDLQQFMREHRDLFLAQQPVTYLGLIGGVYDFLTEE